jgi:diaminohydroxyphosphoribosylaminopyrimidine deaminase/5-amino-6-(5-phosphoribosylamino)uracil reductase
MRRAIALALAQLGKTGGNPAVGCVIVRDGIVIAEGATADGGRPHAEELALDGVQEGARGATAYVTLEPCAIRSGGGSSCSDQLVAAGLSRVVYACADLSVFAAGQGAQKLMNAGISVDQGLMELEARALYVDYVPAKAVESRR